MAEKISPHTRREYTTKLVLILFFLSLFAAFVIWQRERIFELTVFDFALLSLATLRLGRLIAFDVVAEPLRRPFTKTVPDETGAGDTVEARGAGVQRAIGQLISCPICAGTWVAAFLTYGLVIFPQPMRVFLAMTAAISMAEILNSLVETLCWSAQVSRTQAGSMNLARKGEKTAVMKVIPAPDCEEEPVGQVATGEKITPVSREIHR